MRSGRHVQPPRSCDERWPTVADTLIMIANLFDKFGGTESAAINQIQFDKNTATHGHALKILFGSNRVNSRKPS